MGLKSYLKWKARQVASSVKNPKGYLKWRGNQAKQGARIARAAGADVRDDIRYRREVKKEAKMAKKEAKRQAKYDNQSSYGFANPQYTGDKSHGEAADLTGWGRFKKFLKSGSFRPQEEKDGTTFASPIVLVMWLIGAFVAYLLLRFSPFSAAALPASFGIGFLGLAAFIDKEGAKQTLRIIAFIFLLFASWPIHPVIFITMLYVSYFSISTNPLKVGDFAATGASFRTVIGIIMPIALFIFLTASNVNRSIAFGLAGVVLGMFAFNFDYVSKKEAAE